MPIEDRMKSDLDSFGTTIIDCPTRNTKETIDKKIIVDIVEFAMDRTSSRSPPCVILISSDGDYAYMLSRLMRRGVKVVVVHMQNTQVLL